MVILLNKKKYITNIPVIGISLNVKIADVLLFAKIPSVRCIQADIYIHLRGDNLIKVGLLDVPI